MNEQYAILQWSIGVTGEDSLLSWGGVVGQVFTDYQDAAAEAKRVNEIKSKNGLAPNAFVCKGAMTSHLGFLPSKE